MDQTPPAREILDPRVAAWRLLLEVHADLLSELDTLFRTRHHLAVTEFDALINIGPREQVRPKELAQRVILSRTALTRLVDRLCARGWLVREHSVDDRRGLLIALTDEGRRVRREAAITNQTKIAEYFSAINPDDLDTLRRIVKQLKTHNEKDDHP